MTSPAPATPSRASYHHGDLRTALIEAAIELVAERGVRGFSLAEASRRVGVAGSAPYRHFADKDALLAAVGVLAANRLVEMLQRSVAWGAAPEEALAARVRAYIEFAAESRPLFEALLAAGRNKVGRPELIAAVEPIARAFGEPSAALCRDKAQAERLTLAVMAVAHGHATLLGEGAFASREDAAERAVAATRAVVAGKAQLRA